MSLGSMAVLHRMIHLMPVCGASPMVIASNLSGAVALPFAYVLPTIDRTRRR
jgi:hypothetical protein